ncbi:MAG: MATE family efflux transporter [Firmicutes bacterium]|nr:MATE family efflux transporter [Bacillota bacterium]
MAKQLSEDERFYRMTEAPLGKVISSLAIPCIISNLITTIYNMADTFFIGKLSTSASGAVGIALSAMSLIQAMGFFFGQGAGNNVSRLLGAHKTEEASKLTATAFFTCILVSTVFAGCGIFWIEPICRALGATETILPYAVSYLRIIFIGAPFMANGYFLNQQLRYQGLSFYGMIGMGFGGILNMVLDPVFIFAFDMGIAGAALATILSQIISFSILLVCLQTKGEVRIRLRDVSPSAARYKAIYRGGLPSLARQAIGSFAAAALNNAAGVYGDAAVAAMAIVTKIGNFTNACVLGYGQGFQPVCGFCYGAKKYRRVKDAFLYCLRLGTLILVILCAAEAVFAPTLIEVFRKGDPEVTRFGSIALRYHCITFWLTGFSIMNTMLFQVIGKTYKSTVLGLARQGLCLIPVLAVMPALIGEAGVQAAQCAADLIATVIGIIMLKSVWKELSLLEGA